MKILLAALALLLTTLPSTSETPPPEPPEGGITFTYQAACVDKATSEKGMCYVGHDKDGNYYVTFFQDDKLMKISKVVGEEIEVIWMADNFAVY